MRGLLALLGLVAIGSAVVCFATGMNLLKSAEIAEEHARHLSYQRTPDRWFDSGDESYATDRAEQKEVQGWLALAGAPVAFLLGLGYIVASDWVRRKR
jgi:hypothetical protein